MYIFIIHAVYEVTQTAEAIADRVIKNGDKKNVGGCCDDTYVLFGFRFIKVV